jgi:hypothetical protein
MSRAGKKRNM